MVSSEAAKRARGAPRLIEYARAQQGVKPASSVGAHPLSSSCRRRRVLLELEKDNLLRDELLQERRPGWQRSREYGRETLI